MAGSCQEKETLMESNESKMVRFAEDEVILCQGSTEKALYKILHGKAVVYLNYGQEDEYIVGILSEQRCFGEFTLLCGKPSIYTVVAYSDILLLRIPEEDFDSFIRSNSSNAIDIMRNLANTVVTMNFNINLILEELEQSSKMEPEKIREISRRIPHYAPVSAEERPRFSIYG